ncbi:hypothetical protein ACHQM5_027078 [Ranunculus cassubicifolius]
MADAENAPASKKRAAGREISRDNPGLDDDDDAPEETGTFKKASEEVLARRRIVKVKRNPTPPSNTVNPFANINLVPPPSTAEVVTPPKAPEEQAVVGGGEVEEKVEDNGTEKAPATATKTNEKEKEAEVEKTSNTPETNDKEATEEGQKGVEDNGNGETASPSSATTPLNSFQQLSSNQNAFMGISGTGFSSSTFSFGSAAGSGSGSGSGSLFGLKNDGVSFPSFNFNNSNNGTSSKTETTIPVPPMQEVPVETGEENEKAVFAADAILFEYLDGGWKERGKGELKVNVSTTGVGKARLVMRARGNYRLILNAGLFPDMKLASMEKRGITFACMNEGKDTLTTFALKFKDGSIVEEFREVVEVHKGKKSAAPVLKTPENSPKASDE